ncbi:putative early 40.3 kDa protein [Trichinella spiralis]|uniref:Early 40.3 kDa protein n=1 Tax=Trichinella spiralis TaxID=6334 RepID=A0ABR3KC79_TRISP
MGQPAALTICLVFVIRNVVPLKCYHCQAKSDCSFGVCHQGIACVTATVDRYVSKGCLEATVSDKRNLTAGGCVASRWFGSMATVCYCNDRDFCNGTENARAISPRPPLFFLALACVLFTLSMRIFL